MHAVDKVELAGLAEDIFYRFVTVLVQDYSDREARYLSYESLWVQAASMWIIMIFYTWTLTAPLCFPDRDFS